jgi:predicted NAD/FAD-binding protein
VNIGIIGSGVSGLTAAHYLQQSHRVVLFEADGRAGGHTHTVGLMEGERPIPVDMGFIVFNTKTYPNFVKLLGELGVGWAKSDMSLSVSSRRRDFEYAGQSLATLFAQPRRALSPRFLRMVRDILRFNKEASTVLADGPETPILEWLQRRGYSEAFVEDYFFPMLRAVWSANRDIAKRFPAHFLVRFFDNHGFLQLRDAPGWLTIPGGSRTYVHALLRGFSGELRLGTPVRRISRLEHGALVHCDGVAPQRFDHLIVACHADQALALLADPSELERTTLGAIPYQSNQAVLHTDERLMPRLRKTWSSWNVHLDDEHASGACITYWMNRLQPLGARSNYFVTLNRTSEIRPELVLHTETYAHPVFTVEGVKAQASHPALIGHRNTSYAGAYWRNGFHEDGVVSALRVVERLVPGWASTREAA